jgi:hypothetical protein
LNITIAAFHDECLQAIICIRGSASSITGGGGKGGDKDNDDDNLEQSQSIMTSIFGGNKK